MGTQNIGSCFDEFLAGDALLDDVTAIAVKRVIVWKIKQEMALQNLTKANMAKKMRTMRTSYSVLNRLLDETNVRLSLITLIRAATALGKSIRIDLV
jgi:hypothetical protein